LEPIGAKRTDSRGYVWIKSGEINVFDYQGNPLAGAYAWKSNQSLGSLLTNDAIDEFPGGSKYILEDLSKCEQYLFTHNVETEGKFREIVNQAIQEHSMEEKISIEKIEVSNLAGRLQGFVSITCVDKLSFDPDREIAQSIADKLILEYPDEFAKGSERDFWVDLKGCSESGSSSDGVRTYYHTTTWRISDGSFGALV